MVWYHNPFTEIVAPDSFKKKIRPIYPSCSKTASKSNTLWIERLFNYHFWVFRVPNATILLINIASKVQMSLIAHNVFLFFSTISMCCWSVYRSIFLMAQISVVICQKNGLFTITSFENDHGPSVMNHHKQHRNLNCMKRPELVNRKGVIIHHDNATPHTSLATRQKWLRHGWEVMLHPQYSPDLAPSYYYLFRSL